MIPPIQELKNIRTKPIRLDNPYGIGKSYVRMGDVYYQQRMFRLALQQYKQAVDYYIQTGNEKRELLFVSLHKLMLYKSAAIRRSRRICPKMFRCFRHPICIDTIQTTLVSSDNAAKWI